MLCTYFLCITTLYGLKAHVDEMKELVQALLADGMLSRADARTPTHEVLFWAGLLFVRSFCMPIVLAGREVRAGSLCTQTFDCQHNTISSHA